MYFLTSLVSLTRSLKKFDFVVECLNVHLHTRVGVDPLCLTTASYNFRRLIVSWYGNLVVNSTDFPHMVRCYGRILIGIKDFTLKWHFPPLCNCRTYNFLFRNEDERQINIHLKKSEKNCFTFFIFTLCSIDR